MPASYTRTLTAQEAIESVMRSAGLAVPPSIVGSSDKTAVQMLELATDVGQTLMDEANWSFAVAEMTITTEIGTVLYALPDDFNGFVSDAAWNMTTQIPAVGSIPQNEWQELQARLTNGMTLTELFRVYRDQVELHTTPTAEQTIVLPYHSRAWITQADTTRADHIQADDDAILHDPQLFKTGLKLAWYVSKGFDTTRLQYSFMRRLSAAKAKDTPARTLSLAPSRSAYLGAANIPDTGYGS